MEFSLSPSYGGYGAYSSPSVYSNPLGLLGSGIILSLGALFFLYLVLAWIFRSVGLYHMAKNRGIAHAWFAWIPILSQYIVGRLINNKVVLGDDIVVGHASFFLPFLTLLSNSYFTDSSNWLLSVFAMCIWVYNISALWRLFKIYRPNKRTLFTFWSIILTSGFFIFAIRDDKPFDELEPDKIYENYYGGKEVIDREYYRNRAEIRSQEKETSEQLRNEYNAQLSQENLTAEQKHDLREEYQEARQALRRDADDQIRAESREYQQEIQTLENDISEDLDPVVTVPNEDELVITTREPVEEEVTDEAATPIYVEEVPAFASDSFQASETQEPNSLDDDFSETVDSINAYVENRTESND